MRTDTRSGLPRLGLLLALLMVGSLLGGPQRAQSAQAIVLAHPEAALTVCTGGPPTCEYASIQSAINAASVGDTISIAAGVYTESLTIPLSLTVQGAGSRSTIVDANESGTSLGSSVVTVNVGAHVAMRGITLQDGRCIVSGCGINNTGTLLLVASTVTGNSAYLNSEAGGGIYNRYSGTLVLLASVVSNNTSVYGGGGIFNVGRVSLISSTVSGNTAGTIVSTGIGGGIDNYGTVTLINSTVSGNTAGNGGAIANNYPNGTTGHSGTVTLINSTVSGNTATYNAGAIDNYNGQLVLYNSTVSGNTTTYLDGGIYNNGGTVTLTDTILAANTAVSSISDCSGPLTSGGDNVVGNGDGCGGITNGVNGDQVGSSTSPLNPLLGPLQNNGGPTATMALLPGSPALDAVPLAHCPLRVDQRGLPRPDPGDSAACDAGAFEMQD